MLKKYIILSELNVLILFSFIKKIYERQFYKFNFLYCKIIKFNYYFENCFYKSPYKDRFAADAPFFKIFNSLKSFLALMSHKIYAETRQ